MLKHLGICLLPLGLLVVSCSSDDGPAAPEGGLTIPEGGGACSTANCPGCCQGNACMAGKSVATCGSAGLACVKCGGTETCTQGQCVTANTKCNPTKCPSGCCSGDTCTPGTAKEACGKGGVPCTKCASSQKCEKQSCGCGPSTCNGCCDNGICRSGTEISACGQGGKACTTCISPQTCSAGSCTGTATCTPANCNGCCEGSTCKTGKDLLACGQGGQVCKKCVSGETCTQQTCVNTSQCGPGSCTGCCSGTQCLSGLSVTDCGAGGSPCQTCKSTELCTTGACKLDPSSNWGLTVKSASISTAKKWDTLIKTAPDPYVNVTVGSTLNNTTTKDNTYTPVWDEYLMTVKASTITSMGMTIEIRDEDTIGSEQIGICKAKVDEKVLKGGDATLTSCGSSGHIMNIKFKFTPK